MIDEQRILSDVDDLEASVEAIRREFYEGFEQVARITRPAVALFGSARVAEGHPAYEGARVVCECVQRAKDALKPSYRAHVHAELLLRAGMARGPWLYMPASGSVPASASSSSDAPASPAAPQSTSSSPLLQSVDPSQ